MNKEILIVTTDTGVGGVAKYNHALVCNLAQQGYKVHYFQPQAFQNPIEIEQEEKLGINHIWFEENPFQIKHPPRTASESGND